MGHVEEPVNGQSAICYIPYVKYLIYPITGELFRSSVKCRENFSTIQHNGCCERFHLEGWLQNCKFVLQYNPSEGWEKTVSLTVLTLKKEAGI